MTEHTHTHTHAFVYVYVNKNNKKNRPNLENKGEVYRADPRETKK